MLRFLVHADHPMSSREGKKRLAVTPVPRILGNPVPVEEIHSVLEFFLNPFSMERVMYALQSGTEEAPFSGC